MASLIVEFNGEEFDYDPDSLLMSELQEIKKVTGMSRRQWLEALRDEDTDAAQALIYMLRRRRGDDVRIGDIDGAWSSFKVRLADEDDADVEDPTRLPAVEDVAAAAS